MHEICFTPKLSIMAKIPLPVLFVLFVGLALWCYLSNPLSNPDPKEPDHHHPFISINSTQVADHISSDGTYFPWRKLIGSVGLELPQNVGSVQNKVRRLQDCICSCRCSCPPRDCIFCCEQKNGKRD